MRPSGENWRTSTRSRAPCKRIMSLEPREPCNAILRHSRAVCEACRPLRQRSGRRRVEPPLLRGARPEGRRAAPHSSSRVATPPRIMVMR